MKVYHRCRCAEFAEQILADGFRDHEGTWFSGESHSGVWVSDVPLNAADMGHLQGPLLALDIPEEVFGKYEWVDEEGTYREALIPAAVVSSFGPPSLLTEDEEWEAEQETLGSVRSVFK